MRKSAAPMFVFLLDQKLDGGAKKQRRLPSGRLQRQYAPSGEGCASENGTVSLLNSV